MKKICFVNTNKSWGGGEKWHFEVAEALSEKKYIIYFLCHPKGVLKNKLQNKNIILKEVIIKSLSFLNFFKLIYIYFFLKNNDIETIIINQSSDLKTVGFAAKLANVKKIIYRRGSAIAIKDSFSNRLIFKYIVDEIIANSFETKKTINANNEKMFPEDKITVIYNGIKLDEILAIQHQNDLRKKFNISSDEIIIANVGRLTEQKGHKYLFQAINLLKDRTDKKFRLILLGAGELDETLKKTVKDLSIEEIIIFGGFRKDVYEILKQVDFVVHTALWEGFGYVIVESLACGKPVVATNVSNISEIINSEDCGYLVESKNPDEIAKGIFKMINQYSSFSSNAFFTKAREFEFDKKILELEKLI